MRERQPFLAQRPCRKCGDKEATAVFCDGHEFARCQVNEAKEPFREKHAEHIDRFCRRCRYQWIEAPLDAEQDGGL